MTKKQGSRNPIEPLFDRLGNTNPQLLRELRGRLKPGPVLGTLALSIGGQILYTIERFSKLPSPPSARQIFDSTYGRPTHIYCLGEIAPDRMGRDLTTCREALGTLHFWQINWPLWWSDYLTGLHLGAMAIAIVIGCYLLITDWSTEADRGTLDPLRLSPQTAQTILLGKLLGVPSLTYVWLLSCLPIALIAMVNTGRSASHIAGTLAIDGAQLAFWFTTSLLFASVTGKGRGFKGILGAIGAIGLMLFGLQVASSWNEIIRDISSLFGFLSPMFGLVRYVLPVGDWTVRSVAGLREFAGIDDLRIRGSMIGLMIGGISLLLGWSYTAWIALIRRFDRPNATLWSKGQSYWITAGLMVIVLSCATRSLSGYLGATTFFYSKQPETLSRNAILALDVCLSPLFWWLLPLGLALVQPRSVLLDGMRRPVGSAPREKTRRDLIWGEFSPPWVALGIQVAIALTGVVIFSLVQLRALPIGGVGRTLAETQGFWGPVLMANLLLLLVSLVQLIQLNSRRLALLWSGLAVAIGLFAVPIALSMVGARTSHPLWLLSFYPFAAISEIDNGAILVLVLAEWLGLVVMYNRFKSRLRHLAKSDVAAAVES
jgi:hypothetical protein